MVGKLIRGVRIVFAQPDRYLQLSLMMSLKNEVSFSNSPNNSGAGTARHLVSVAERCSHIAQITSSDDRRRAMLLGIP